MGGKELLGEVQMEWNKAEPGEVGGEGSGTPLQSSCLENPMDRGAWWAAVQGVAQSRTRLKQLSSSSSSSSVYMSIPIFQFISPLPLTPPNDLKFVFYICDSKGIVF